MLHSLNKILILLPAILIVGCRDATDAGCLFRAKAARYHDSISRVYFQTNSVYTVEGLINVSSINNEGSEAKSNSKYRGTFALCSGALGDRTNGALYKLDVALSGEKKAGRTGEKPISINVVGAVTNDVLVNWNDSSFQATRYISILTSIPAGYRLSLFNGFSESLGKILGDTWEGIVIFENKGEVSIGRGECLLRCYSLGHCRKNDAYLNFESSFVVNGDGVIQMAQCHVSEAFKVLCGGASQNVITNRIEVVHDIAFNFNGH